MERTTHLVLYGDPSTVKLLRNHLMMMMCKTILPPPSAKTPAAKTICYAYGWMAIGNIAPHRIIEFNYMYRTYIPIKSAMLPSSIFSTSSNTNYRIFSKSSVTARKSINRIKWTTYSFHRLLLAAAIIAPPVLYFYHLPAAFL